MIKPDATTQSIAAELNLPERQVHSAVELLNAGNTIPFIARYRKEATSGLNEIELRAIEDALERANALAARKLTVLKTIKELGQLTDELKSKIDNCSDLRTWKLFTCRTNRSGEPRRRSQEKEDFNRLLTS